PVDQHAVQASELVGASLEGPGMDLDPVSRRGARKVNGIELPETGAGGLEAKRRRALLRGHRSFLRSWLDPGVPAEHPSDGSLSAILANPGGGSSDPGDRRFGQGSRSIPVDARSLRFRDPPHAADL